AGGELLLLGPGHPITDKDIGSARSGIGKYLAVGANDCRFAAQTDRLSKAVMCRAIGGHKFLLLRPSGSIPDEDKRRASVAIRDSPDSPDDCCIALNGHGNAKTITLGASHGKVLLLHPARAIAHKDIGRALILI